MKRTTMKIFLIITWILFSCLVTYSFGFNATTAIIMTTSLLISKVILDLNTCEHDHLLTDSIDKTKRKKKKLVKYG